MFCFVDTKSYKKYFTAERVIEAAKNNGFVPYISTDNRLHPSSMCNRYMHRVLGNQAYRLKYHLGPDAMIKIIRNEKSESFLQFVANELGKTMAMFSSGKLNLYSAEAARALISMMSEKTEVVFDANEYDVFDIPKGLDIEKKTVENRRERNITSIFGRKK